MGTTKKRRTRKKFRYINRKKLNKKRKKITALIQCDDVKKEWDDKKSVKQNMRNMGLAFDTNVTIKIPKSVTLVPGEEVKQPVNKRPPQKVHVVEAIEEDANAPRERQFRLPKGQVQWITYLMEKYGEDYKAMERDRKNYYQETWKQLRAKVKQFKGVPEQYEEYLKSKEQTGS